VTISPKLRTAALVSALVAALLAGQMIVDAKAGSSPTKVGATVGRAGFAYATGLRRFAAVILWNRIEPQFHGYYSGQPLKDLVFLMPNMYGILMLDPQFIQPYYITPWILIGNGKVDEGIALAKRGIANNPDSGLLHSSLAQIYYLKTSDLKAAVAEADLAMRPNQVWADATQEWQGIRVLRDIYLKAGLTDRVAETDRITALIEKDLGAAPGFRDPDEQF